MGARPAWGVRSRAGTTICESASGAGSRGITDGDAIDPELAISVDLHLGGQSTMSDALFWSSLYISLSLGLFAAWPANLLLIKFGLKGGMGDPRDTEAAASGHCH